MADDAATGYNDDRYYTVYLDTTVAADDTGFVWETFPVEITDNGNCRATVTGQKRVTNQDGYGAWLIGAYSGTNADSFVPLPPEKGGVEIEVRAWDKDGSNIPLPSGLQREKTPTKSLDPLFPAMNYDVPRDNTWEMARLYPFHVGDENGDGTSEYTLRPDSKTKTPWYTGDGTWIPSGSTIQIRQTYYDQNCNPAWNNWNLAGKELTVGVDIAAPSRVAPKPESASTEFYIMPRPEVNVRKQALGSNGSDPAKASSEIQSDGSVLHHARYRIDVENLSAVNANHDTIYERPRQIPGFTIEGVQVAPVGGQAQSAQLEQNAYVVTGAGSLAPRETKSFEVTVSYRENNPTAENWANAEKCEAGNKESGAFNTVSMNGELEGFGDDNDACVELSRQPVFDVKKTAKTPVAEAIGDEFRAEYEVVVENIGGGASTSGAITDMPRTLDGFTIARVLVDGTEVNPDQDGNYLISEGVDLPAGTGTNPATKAFKVEVFYTPTDDVTPDNWSDAAVCEAPDAEGESKTGAVNVVKLAGEPEGRTGDNDACVEIHKDPVFDVVKAADAEQAVNISGAEGNTFEANYTVSVRNIGGVNGSFGEVRDFPRQVPGFTIERVVVDGDERRPVLANGAEVPAEGLVISRGEELKAVAGETATRNFQIRVVYVKNADATSQQLEDAEKCEPTGEDRPASQTGAVNVVTLADEPAGKEGDNDACVSIPRVPTFKVKKVADEPQAEVNEDGTETIFVARHTITVTNNGPVAGVSGKVEDLVPPLPGFEIADRNAANQPQIRVNGQLVNPQGNRYYVVSEGVDLAKDESKTFQIEVRYRALKNATDAQRDNAAVRDPNPDLTKDPRGAVNFVRLQGEVDSEQDNASCVTIPTKPTFSVKKVADVDGPVGLEKQTDPNDPATVTGYTFEHTYTVTLTNTGGIKGESPVVWDTPAIDQGVTITEVLVDNVARTAENGRYKITDPVVIEAGGSIPFLVTVRGKATRDAAIALKPVEEQCTVSDPAVAGEPFGLKNTVSFDGKIVDTDGSDNNTVCNPVVNPDITVKKYINGKDAQSPIDPALVKAGEDMEITYVVKNVGNVKLSNITITDKVTAAFKEEDVDGLQGLIDAELAKGENKVVELAAGEEKSITITVPAPEGFHANEATVSGESNEPVDPNDPDGPKKTVESPKDPGNSAEAKLKITKLINGLDANTWDEAAVVKPGDDMKITYRVENTGKVTVDDIRVTDRVDYAADQVALQGQIDAALRDWAKANGFEANGFTLKPGEFRNIRVTVKAQEGDHTNFAKATGIVPGDPGDPGDPNDPNDDVPGTPDTPVDSQEDPGNSKNPPVSRELKIKKYVNGRDAEVAGDVPVLNPGEDMVIRYVVTNYGNVQIDGIKVIDEVVEGSDEVKTELGKAIAEALENEPEFNLAPGESKEITVTVKAPAGAHVNEAKLTVPPTTVTSTLPPTVVTTTPDGGTPTTYTTRPVVTTDVTVTTPSDKGRHDSPGIGIKKFVNGRDAESDEDFPMVMPGDPLTIRYELTNTGSVPLTGVKVTDTVKQAKHAKDRKELQSAINAALTTVPPVDVPVGATKTIEITVKAPEGTHVNEAMPIVPPITVPGTTVPATTIPASTLPPTTNKTTTRTATVTVPASTRPASEVPGTTVTPTTPQDKGGSKPGEPGLSVKKYINGRDAEDVNDAPAVNPGEWMEIYYRVANTGNTKFEAVTLADTVEGANQTLQAAINGELAKVGPFDLAPGEVRDIRIMVQAPEGSHVNEVKVVVPTTETSIPETTVPGTTIPETTLVSTVPGTTNPSTTVPATTVPVTKPGTTVPATTIPSTVITPNNPPVSTTPSDKGRSDVYKLGIKKYVNGLDAEEGQEIPTVVPGEDMTIKYVITNEGTVDLKGITLDDEVTAGLNDEEKRKLQDAISKQLKGKTFDLAAGASTEVVITVPAPAGGHVNVAKAIPPTVTRPASTIPLTTYVTTVPGKPGEPGTPTTVTESSEVPGTTISIPTPSDEGRSTPTALAPKPGLEVKKFINGQDAETQKDAAVVNHGDKMTITYRVANTGTVPFYGLKLVDQVKGENPALQGDIDDQLPKAFDLAPGELKEFTVTVNAPEGTHENKVEVTVPSEVPTPTTVNGTPTTVTKTNPSLTTTPSDKGNSKDRALSIKKYVSSNAKNRSDAEEGDSIPTIKPGEKLTIEYVVANIGQVDIDNIDITDEVVGDTPAGLQEAINAELDKLRDNGQLPFTLKKGDKPRTFKITVDAPQGAHINWAQPVAPTTIPEITVPGTTIPGTTVTGVTTIPGTVVTETKIPPTVVTVTAPKDRGASSPEGGLTVKKFINGRDAESLDDAAAIVPGDDMVITYRVVNTGNVDYFGLSLADTVTQSPEGGLGEAIAKQLAEQVGTFDLPAGQGREFSITVPAEEGTHENEVVVEVPSTVPGTTNATTTNPGTTNPVPSTVPSDKGGSKDYGLRIKKFVDGFDAEASGDASATVVPTVTPGADMVIRYVVENTGNAALSGVRIVDEVEGDSEAAGKLQRDIEQALADKVVDLEPKTSTEVEVTVPAPAEAHVNFAHPVAVTTVPEVTIPATTLPGTTIPETVVSSTVVTVTAPKDRGASTPTVDTPAPEPKAGLEVKKFINGRDDNALVTAGEDMEITYRVTNTGEMTLDGIRLLDEVKEDNADLQQQIDAQLGKQPSFGLAPGESREVTVTVKAPVGRHDNAVRVTVPPVTVPGTTVPGTSVPETVVTVTAPSDDASSDSPQLAIAKEIKAADEDEDAWRDAEEAADALPVAPGADMQLRYTVTNTGSVDLAGIDVVDSVTRLDGGDADAFAELINQQLAAEGRGIALAPGESKAIVITVAAPEGYHVNEAIATAPPVTATETVVTSVPGTTDATTTVPGVVTTETTVVERVPNTPVDKAQSTPEPKADPTPCNCTPVTTTIQPSPVTVTLTTPVPTVTTFTPEPSTVVTTVVATPTPTTTPGGGTVVVTPATTTPKPGRVIVIVDEGGNTVTRITPAPEEGGSPSETETVTYTIPGGKTTTTLTTEPGGNTVNKCVANAVRSPILYMVPLLLAGQVLGDAAAPYIAQFNDQFNKINAEIQEEIRRNTPDLGFGRRGHENEQVAQLRARLDEANRQLGQLMNRPEVREYGKWAAVALGVVVAGSVLYDWCTNEEGEAFTAIGPKKTTTIDDVRVGGSSLLGRGGATTSVAPVTQTPEGETAQGSSNEPLGESSTGSSE